MVAHVFRLLNRLRQCREMAVEALDHAKEKRKTYYDKKAREVEFKEGEKVLILSTAKGNKLAVCWTGPGIILSKLSDTNYVVQLPEKRNKSQVYHVNMMKRYYDRNAEVNRVELMEGDAGEDEIVSVPTGDSNDVYPFTLMSVGPQLNVEEKEQLSGVINQYREIFTNVPGLTTLVEHDISLNTPTEALIAKPYKMSPRHLAILKREIDNMKELGIIVEGTSSFTSPMIIVEAPGKDPRPCVDYRRINKITKTQYYPIPNVEQRIEAVSQAHFISIIDMTKGYFQIPLTEEARKYAAFVTPFGTYLPLRMAFGLKNAPFEFNRLMANLLKGMEHFAIPYFDDVAIISRKEHLSYSWKEHLSYTWKEHLLHLKAVFQVMKDAHLTIKQRKCKLAQKSVEYLGHMVGQGKLSPALRKIEIIRNYPQPKTKREIRSFLGFLGYYRRYIKDFSTIAAPLSDLTKGRNKTGPVLWNDKCEEAFQELKRRITNEPVLTTPNPDLNYILQADASLEGMGIVLSQLDDEGNEHPNLFLSRKFRGAEKRYSTTEKECLAIVWGINKLKCYLDSAKPFTVVTDHNPLKYLMSTSSGNSRLLRWALFLQTYEFDIVHKKEKNHVNADALSRVFQEKE